MSVRKGFFVVVSVLLIATPLFALDDVPLNNWAVPSAGRYSTLVDSGAPAIFVGMQPCRVVDTRVGQGFSGAYGPPSLVANSSRAFPIQASPQCTGIPTGASAYSLNFTVIASAGPYSGAYLSAWPTGGTQPTVSTLNFAGGQIVANAAIVPAGSNSITVITNAAADLIVDINGYFIGSGGSMNGGEYLRVQGTWDSGGGVLFVQNLTTSFGYSVNSYLNNAVTGSAATIGQQVGGTGINYGLAGVNASTTPDSAGVHGVSVGQTLSSGWTHQGVRGESTTGNGIIGITACTGCVGVRGDYVNGSGTTLSFGILGLNTGGVVYGGGLNGSGTKSFVEPHPTDATKAIKYICLEGPEAGTYFRGRGRFVDHVAHIDVPENFRMVSDPEGLTVQITPLGRMASVGVVSVSLDGIEVEANRDVEFSYLVQGVRRAYANENPIVENLWFRPRGPEDKIPAYLSANERQRLIDNGTYNTDGSVNMTTAERVGWAQQWKDEAEAQRAAGEAASKKLQQQAQTGGIPLLH